MGPRAPAGSLGAFGAHADLQSRAAIVARLQGACGNRQVQRLVAQTCSAVTPGVTLDPDALTDKLYRLSLVGFAGVCEEHKLVLAEQILSTLSRAHRGPQVMFELWKSFGERVVPVAAANPDLWRRCAAYVPRPLELHNLPPILKLATAFRRDVERVAEDHLEHNHDVVEAEKDRVFGTTASKPPGRRIANDEAMRRIQGGAELVLRHHQRREALRKTQVGTQIAPALHGGEMRLPVTFRPDVDPTAHHGYSAKGAARSWKDVKAEDDKLRLVVSTILSEHPALFALLRDGKLGGFHLAEGIGGSIGRGAAQLALGEGLDQLLADIENAQLALSLGELEPFDFLPIHKQLLEGDAAGSERWTQPFYAWVATDALSRHKRSEFWKGLGLTSLAAAAFLLAEFATLGFATVAFAGVGVAVTGNQVAGAYDQWADVDLAHRAAAGQGTDLVYEQQVRDAKIDFYIEAALGLFDIATAPAAFAKLAGGWKAGGLAGESLARGAGAAESLGQKVASLTEATPDGAKILEGAIDVLGLDAVLAATTLPRSALLRIAGNSTSLHLKLMTTAFFTSDGIRAAFPVAVDQLTGKAARTMSAYELDTAFQHALTTLGPTEVVRRVGGWDTLVSKLGETSNTAQQIRDIRDVQLPRAMEEFARAHLPKPPTQDGFFVRTGTQGSSLNDFDVSALGPYSAENKAKLQAFAAGYLGIGEAELKKLFKIQFFGDPTRLHLADYLTAEASVRVGRSLGRFEDELVLNRLLHEALQNDDVAGAAMARQLMAAAGVPQVYRPAGQLLEDLGRNIDGWHGEFLGTTDATRRAELAERIHMATSQINAIEEGGFLTAGAAKRLVTDKEGLASKLKLPEVALETSHELGIVLDQVLKAANEVQAIRGRLGNGELLVGVKEMSKIFDRFAEVVERVAATTPAAMLKPGSSAFARHEQLVLDLLPFARESRELLAGARGTAAVKLSDRITISNTEVASAARSAADQFAELVPPVLEMLRRRARIEAGLGNASLLEKGQDLVAGEVRVIWAKNEVHRILDQLDRIPRTADGVSYVAQVLCGLNKARPDYGKPPEAER